MIKEPDFRNTMKKKILMLQTGTIHEMLREKVEDLLEREAKAVNHSLSKILFVRACEDEKIPEPNKNTATI